MRSDYPEIIGKRIRGTVDRPIGSSHPQHPDMIYPVNYGYANDIMAEDGAEQDVYLIGADKPVSQFEAVIIAVYRRFDDIEDKWIASNDGTDFSDDEILKLIHFQEQYFFGELLR